jgi:deoxyadenosine/deoxycytidine kinase
MESAPSVLIIESEIGGGKSTLGPLVAAEACRRGRPAVFVPEPAGEWGDILPRFYADPARWAYAFQTFVYATRIRAVQRAVAANPGARLFVLERSPVTDEIFMELQRDSVAPVEMEMYEVWRRTFAPLLPLDLSKAAVVYLQPSLSVCMARVAGRARAGEAALPLAYQQRLRRAHEALLLGAHAEEFPQLATRPPPYPRAAVRVIPAALADLNFKDPGPSQDAVVAAALEVA